MAKATVIGLLGGGQLGRMLQEQAALLGIEILVLDAASCPVRQINQNDGHVAGSFKDPEQVRELARRCDALTVEIEHVNTEVLEEIATRGVLLDDGTHKRVPVHPSWETLRLIQDKFLQKEHFRRARMPVAPQMSVEPGDGMKACLKAAADAFGFPLMLKARKDSYDGRGNFKIEGPKNLDDAIAVMGGLSLYVEKFQPFTKELAVMVVRTEDDQGNLRDVHAYPAVETVHEDSICSKVFYPPRHVSHQASERARKLASDVIRTLKGRGVFAVEMFLLENGEFASSSSCISLGPKWAFQCANRAADELVINEVAPRP